jgi:hypothetical protein
VQGKDGEGGAATDGEGRCSRAAQSLAPTCMVAPSSGGARRVACTVAAPQPAGTAAQRQPCRPSGGRLAGAAGRAARGPQACALCCSSSHIRQHQRSNLGLLGRAAMLTTCIGDALQHLHRQHQPQRGEGRQQAVRSQADDQHQHGGIQHCRPGTGVRASGWVGVSRHANVGSKGGLWGQRPSARGGHRGKVHCRHARLMTDEWLMKKIRPANAMTPCSAGRA